MHSEVGGHGASFDRAGESWHAMRLCGWDPSRYVIISIFISSLGVAAFQMLQDGHVGKVFGYNVPFAGLHVEKRERWLSIVRYLPAKSPTRK